MVVNDEPAFVAAFLGALRVGIVPVPVSTMLTAADLAVIAADAGARALLVSEAYEPYVTTIVAAPEVTTKIVVGEPTLPGVHAWNELDDRTDVAAADARRDRSRLLAVHVRDDRHTEGRNAPARRPRGDRPDVRGGRCSRSRPRIAATRSRSCSSWTGSETR